MALAGISEGMKLFVKMNMASDCRTILNIERMITRRVTKDHEIIALKYPGSTSFSPYLHL